MASHTNGKAGLAKALTPPRTTCKICWCSVYENDETTWVNGTTPGIAHKICADETSATTKD